MYFPREEYEQRWAQVYAAMASFGYETLVIWQRSAGGFDRAGNVYWLTGYASSVSGQENIMEPFPVGMAFAAALFRKGQEPELHISESKGTTDCANFVCGALYDHENLLEGLADRLRALGVEGRVAYIGDDLLPTMYDRILRARTPHIEWVPEESLLREPQAIKSSRELEAYREGGEVATRSLTAAMEALIAGETEGEAAARAAAIVLRAGGGLQRVALHHGRKSEVNYWSNAFYGFDTSAPAAGDMVRGWIYGPIFQGYWFDPGRSAVCGNRPTPEQRALIEGAVEIVDTIIAAARPGVTTRQLGIAGDTCARKHGFYDQKQLPLGLYGHGLGSFFSAQYIPAGDAATATDGDGSLQFDVPLRSGMVFSSETFLTHTGVGSATFEQNFIITDAGAELLTKTPMIFW